MPDSPILSRVKIPAGYVLADSGTDAWSRGMAARTRGLFRFIYASNPLYVVSAGLVFSGLRMSLDTSVDSFESLDLMAALAVYILALAAGACFLIRFAAAWQEARTILLLIGLLFLAFSVTFDETLANNPRLGTRCFLAGLAFSIALSEGLLRTIRLSLPAWFRLPYFLILALFFLYPVAIGPWVSDGLDAKVHWALFGFCSVAGLVFLALLPAVRRGPQYVRDNGSPWRWPWYPWVLFAVLGLGVCGRAAMLCMSLDPIGGDGSIFGLYFLVPFLLAVSVLLLEAGIVSGQTCTMRLALMVPAGLVALAVTGSPGEASDQGFLETFSETFRASPLFLTLTAAIAFYAVAMLRRVPHASTGLTAALAALMVCGPGTFNHATLVDLHVGPLMLISVVQLAIALRRRSAPRCLLAACCGLAAVGWYAYGYLQQIRTGLGLIGVGTLLLLLAFLVSLTGTSVLKEWFAQERRED